MQYKLNTININKRAKYVTQFQRVIPEAAKLNEYDFLQCVLVFINVIVQMCSMCSIPSTEAVNFCNLIWSPILKKRK